MVVSSVFVPVKQMEDKREAELCPDNQWGLGPIASLCSSCFTDCLFFPCLLGQFSTDLTLEHDPLPIAALFS